MKILKFKKIDSTNSEAKRLIQSNKSIEKEGIFIVSEEQTQGYGKFKRRFFSSQGGLYFTYIKKENPSFNLFTSITLSIGVLIAETLTRHFHKNFLVKWPNDIIINHKKLCGILCETIINPKNIYIILGAGININNHVSHLNINATSLSEELNTTISKTKIDYLKNELFQLIQNFFLYPQVKEKYFEKFSSYDYLFNKTIQLTRDTEIQTGIAKGITKNGNLILKSRNKTIYINSGDIKVLYNK